jgi:hypothetical protein
LSDIDLRGAPEQVTWGGRVFSMRNQNSASVEYVLGEVYWKCQIGETTRVSDFTNGRDVLSREESPGEVHWSYSAPIAWPVLAQAFGLPVHGPGGQGRHAGSAPKGGLSSAAILLILIVIVLVICMLGACGSCVDDTTGGGGAVRGGGIFVGGK